MRVLCFDGQAGAAGDMILAALIDLGVDPARLSDALSNIVPAPFTIEVESARVYGIAAKRVHVRVTEDVKHRSLGEVLALLDRGDLSAPVRERAASVFRRLAVAEAQIHSSTPQTVRFHEVGANDAIVDIAGAIWALAELGIEQVFCEPLVLGSGVGRSAHGPIIYPAPAVLEILKGRPVHHVADLGETTTPTGAAILAEVAEFTTTLLLTPDRTGYGAGTKSLADRPNVLRATTGTLAHGFESDLLWVVASDIDNTRPEVFDWLTEKLRAAGAVDVAILDVGMKKNRRGVRIEALCPAEQRAALAEVILAETGSLGVRWWPVRRSKLKRHVETISTPWGPIRLKVAETAGGPRAVAEYDDCRDAAARSGEPLALIFQTVERLFRDQAPGNTGLPSKG